MLVIYRNTYFKKKSDANINVAVTLMKYKYFII